MGWNGAGGWAIFSHDRQVNFSRTVWITFHCRGITSSVSVTSSPSLTSLPPQPLVDAIGRKVDPLEQQPDDPRLLGREQLVPQQREVGDDLDDLTLRSLKFMVRRRPCPRDDLR